MINWFRWYAYLCIFCRTLDVECKMRDSDNILKYTCKQFPGPVVASEAQFEVFVCILFCVFRNRFIGS